MSLILAVTFTVCDEVSSVIKLINPASVTTEFHCLVMVCVLCLEL